MSPDKAALMNLQSPKAATLFSLCPGFAFMVFIVISPLQIDQLQDFNNIFYFLYQGGHE